MRKFTQNPLLMLLCHLDSDTREEHGLQRNYSPIHDYSRELPPPQVHDFQTVDLINHRYTWSLSLAFWSSLSRLIV
jgi:hypothetical protein